MNLELKVREVSNSEEIETVKLDSFHKDNGEQWITLEFCNTPDTKFHGTFKPGQLYTISLNKTETIP